MLEGCRAGRGAAVLAVAIVALGACASVGARPRHRHPPRPRAWYVSASAQAGGNGSRRRPFGSLAAVERASRAGDTIVVLPSRASVPPLDGGIALKRGQRLIGAGPRVVGSRRSSLPRIANTDAHEHAGDAVELATGAVVRNLVIGPAYRGGVYGSGVTRVTVQGDDLSGTDTSCTTGFVVQPFVLPTLAPGVGVPFSSGLPNGWAAVMVDERRGRASLTVAGNRIHDAGCADGIDVRASGTSRVSARVVRNSVTRLQEGSNQQSVLAIGMQSLDRAALTAQVSHNDESYIGSATSGDEGDADSEGLFANGAGRSRLVEHADHNTYAHGLGHLSANCFEVVSSNGGPTIHATLSHSTCDHVVGDILEAVNLSRDATMTFAIDHVRAAHSEFVAGPAFHQVEPGDDGDCLLEAASGAASTTSVTISHSLFTDCVTDGLGVVSNVVDGSGPVRSLSFDVRDSRITANGLSNVRVANSTPVSRLDGRVERSDLSGSPEGTPVILENLDTSGGTHARLDFGGGALGSRGGNCVFGGSALDVQSVGYGASARGDWWGQAGGPAPGRVVAAGGSVDTSGALGRPPRGTC